MVKSDVTLEQVRAKVDSLAQELGLLFKDTSGFLKVQGPTTKHRIYIQLSKNLNRIDCTIELPQDDPAYKQMKAPNGSIRCNIVPDMDQLERVLRMLADTTMATQVPNKPRPFAATKQPAARKPKATSLQVPEDELVEVDNSPRLELEDRLKKIHARARELRINRIMEERGLDRSEAEAVMDNKLEASDAAAAQSHAAASELNETLSEAGIEVS